MKTGVVDVGGGLRGIYGAGIFDYCMEHKIVFDYAIGVSAGSANVASYIAGQIKRNWAFYYDYVFRREYMSFHNLLHKRSYIDLDYVYSTLSNADGENPLDYQAFAKNPCEMEVVATKAEDGSAVYFNKKDIKQDCYDALKASCSIPVVCRPYYIDGIPYFDGALSDPVPVKRAREAGCDKVVLILTKPLATERTSEKDEKIARILKRSYPEAAKHLVDRAAVYNKSVREAVRQQEQGSLLILAPDDITGVDTLKKDKDALKRLYQKGYHDAEKIKSFLER